ncbi:MAG: RluA family pseudouridine synthase [Candidatus Liptonbacteria bacterium]|nr:RluA family pseudouridine synthase [Candidatus Liptonbacteria bacterium]
MGIKPVSEVSEARPRTVRLIGYNLNIVDQPEVIYETREFLAVNKPAGWLTHGIAKSEERRAKSEKGKGKREKRKGSLRSPLSAPRSPLLVPVLTEWLLARYPEIARVGDKPAERPGIVHRLDRETSGALLVARTQARFESLKRLFQARQIRKRYQALVLGEITERSGRITAPIGIQSGTIRRSTRAERMVKTAVTEFRTRRVKGGYSLLDVWPETGRTHQIRVHLASLGHPVVGDRLYGPKRQPSWADALVLHARSLEFSPSSGERLRIEAPPPASFRAAVRHAFGGRFHIRTKLVLGRRAEGDK